MFYFTSLWLCLSFALVTASSASLIIKDLRRTVNLENRIVHVTAKTLLSNPSSSDDAPYFYISLPNDVHNYVGQIRIRHSNSYINVQNVSYIETLTEDLEHFPREHLDHFVLYRVPLRIPKLSDLTYELEYFVGRSHRPFPRSTSFKVNWVST